MSSPDTVALIAEPVDWRQHTMGSSLFPYLKMKVHHLVQDYSWGTIRIIGKYDRSCAVSTHEKSDKQFNWQRPTAEPCGNELVVKCFPGADYVRHYSLILATYLKMQGRYRGQVSYEIPSSWVCDTQIARIELDMTGVDVVVTGWGLPRLAGSSGWTPGAGFASKKVRLVGATVLYLGFMHSIWGEVAGRVVKHLALLGAQRVLYIGKVGTLVSHWRPNMFLATGTGSLVGSEYVTWDNFFDENILLRENVIRGKHVTSASTLLETREWLAAHRPYSFVDPEIGRMGAAAREAGITFGYLHIVSNNLARAYRADLSNERAKNVLSARARLLDEVSEILQERLATTKGPKENGTS